jgi:lipid-A-disaccharide synthase
VWAWKESRVRGIKKNVDKMLVIFPFEKDFYRKWGLDVEYVGHPLVKVVDDFKESNTVLETAVNINIISSSESSINQPIIAVLPGSRKQEILTKLPIMLSVAKHFPDYHFVVAKAPGIEDDFYQALLSPYENVSSVINQTYPLLCVAKAALVTSGTATLETALFGVPEVVCYKGSALSFQIAKWLITIQYICLVNLIMKKEVVKELIQEQLTEKNLSSELKKILYNEDKQSQLRDDYIALKNLLSQGGNASANAAKSIYHFLHA